MRELKFRALKDDMSDCRFVYGNLLYLDDIVVEIKKGHKGGWQLAPTLFWN